MSSQFHAQIEPASSPVPAFAPASRGLLQRKCACGGTHGVDGLCEACRGQRLTGVQTKLRVNEPGDRYEQEADRIADEVMRMPEPTVQREGVAEEEEEDETLQMKPLAAEITPLVQREATPEEEDDEEEIALQRQALTDEEEPEEEEEEEVVQTKRAGPQVPTVTSAVEAAVQSVRQSEGQPLDPTTRAFMEPRFGHDFGHVRIHSSSDAAAVAHTLRARAFTLTSDVIFGEGQYAPHTSAGKRLLAHELTHVLQQRIGIAQRASAANGAAQVDASGARGIDASELDGAVELPRDVKADVRQRHSATRTVLLQVDDTMKERMAVSQIDRLDLLAGNTTHAARLAVQYSVRVSQGLTDDPDKWNEDTIRVGQHSPALRPHEQAHLRVTQLALRSELHRHPETKSARTLDEAFLVLQTSATRAKDISGLVNAKMDVRTLHGEDFRPQKRFERENKLRREIRRAERLRGRRERRFDKRLGRLTEASDALLPTQHQQEAVPTHEGEGGMLQMNALAVHPMPLVQRESIPHGNGDTEQITLPNQALKEREEDEETDEFVVQPKSVGRPTETVASVEAAVQCVRQRGGMPLDAAARAFMEPRFGRGFGQVRIHTSSRAATAARGLRARAFTIGRDVAFGTGEYAPSSRKGQQLLAHELVHVMQQVGPLQLSRSPDPPEGQGAEPSGIVAIPWLPGGKKGEEGLYESLKKYIKSRFEELTDKDADNVVENVRKSEAGLFGKTKSKARIRPAGIEEVALGASKAGVFGLDPGAVLLIADELVKYQPALTRDEAMVRLLSKKGGLIDTPALRDLEKSGEAFLEGFEKALEESPLDKEEKKKLIANAKTAVVLWPIFYLGVSEGIYREAIETLTGLPGIPETIKAAIERAETLFTPQGRELAYDIGQQAGRSITESARDFAGMRAPSFTYELGVLVGPLLLTVVLSLYSGVASTGRKVLDVTKPPKVPSKPRSGALKRPPVREDPIRTAKPKKRASELVESASDKLNKGKTWNELSLDEQSAFGTHMHREVETLIKPRLEGAYEVEVRGKRLSAFSQAQVEEWRAKKARIVLVEKATPYSKPDYVMLDFYKGEVQVIDLEARPRRAHQNKTKRDFERLRRMTGLKRGSAIEYYYIDKNDKLLPKDKLLKAVLITTTE